MTSNELQERLIDYTVSIISLTGKISKSSAGITLINQITRSGISCALNYGESCGAESSKDFIHKLQIVLKELRETWVSLRIIQKAKLTADYDLLERCIGETNQLISIFTKSVTSNKNKLK